MPPAKRRILTSHDAFGYFGARYGIEFVGIEGISTEAEPSAAAIAALVKQIRAEGIKAVFVENMTSPRLARMVARESGAVLGPTVYSDALSPPGGPADTYLKMFRHNVTLFVAGDAGELSVASRYSSPSRPEAEPASVADDDVVVQHDRQGAAGRASPPASSRCRRATASGSPLGWLCTRISAVACSSSARLHHLARVDRRVVDGAARLRLVGQQAVAGVEEQHPELLDRLARQHGVEVGHQPVPVVQDRLLDRPRRGPCAQRGGPDDPERDRAVLADAGLSQQLPRRRGETRGETAEPVDQRAWPAASCRRP